MLVRQVISRFEFELSPEVLKAAAEPGTSFRQQIQMPEDTEELHEGAIRGLPGQAVYLEKFTDTLIKLFVTVYKAEGSDISASTQTDVQTNKTRPTQTDIKLLNDNESQTVIRTFAETDMQTDIRSYADFDTQTDKLPCRNIRLQTEIQPGLEIETQTLTQEYSDTSMQTDRTAVKGSVTQTEIHEYKETEVQTEKHAVKNGVVQTTILEYRECDVQTDIREYGEAVSQTDVQETCSSECQTSETRVNQQHADVTCETDCNIATQVDCAIMAVVRKKEVAQQASPEYGESVSQTETREMMEAGTQAVAQSLQHTTQTDISMALQADSSIQATADVSDLVTQTDVQETRMNQCQTSETRVHQQHADVTCETECNIATQVDCAIMAVVRKKEAAQQAAPEYGESLSQTEACEMIEAGTQAVTLSLQHTTQTDISMALQTDMSMQSDAQGVSDQWSQATTETSETLSQTLPSAECSDALSQTSLSMMKSSDQNSQTVDSFQSSDQVQNKSAVGEGLDQAAAVNHTAAHINARSLEEKTRQELDTIGVSSETSVTSLAASESDTTLPGYNDTSFDTSLIGASFTDVVTPVKQSQRTTRESIAQTDPVTIIIGDASFLLKKLKSSASSPSKVTTTGNEIEIEVNVDQSEQQQPAHHTAANNSYTQPSHSGFNPQQQGLRGTEWSGGLQMRGPSPQYPARGGMGPRVRMPVVRQQQAPPRPVTQPPQVVADALAGPPHVAGGNFSCPFCAFTFIDSPALYEHLSINHTVDQKNKWKQPKGRQGKTIIPQALRKQQQEAAENAARGGSVGLFEDAPGADDEGSGAKKKRGRPAGLGRGGRGGSVRSDEDYTPPTKRQNIS